jgi:hypothetical protein
MERTEKLNSKSTVQRRTLLCNRKSYQMEFVLILERDESAHETYFNYCQWTDNEYEMMTLIRQIKSVKEEDFERLSVNKNQFYVADGLVPEAMVDVHVGLVFNIAANPYYKYTGGFVCPSFRKMDTIPDDDGDDSDDSGSDSSSDSGSSRGDADQESEPDESEPDEPEPDHPAESPLSEDMDMELEEGFDEVAGLESARRLDYYFRNNGFAKYFRK